MRNQFLIVFLSSMLSLPAIASGLGTELSNIGQSLANTAKELLKGAGNLVTLNQCSDYEWDEYHKALRKMNAQLKQISEATSKEIIDYKFNLEMEFRENRIQFLESAQRDRKFKIEHLLQTIDMQKDLISCLITSVADYGVLDSSLRQTEAMQTFIQKLNLRQKDLTKVDDLKMVFTTTGGFKLDYTKNLLKAALLDAYLPADLHALRIALEKQVEASIRLREKLLVDLKLSNDEISFLKLKDPNQ